MNGRVAIKRTISAAKAGVPINPATAATVANFFMESPQIHAKINIKRPGELLLPRHTQRKSANIR